MHRMCVWESEGSNRNCNWEGIVCNSDFERRLDGCLGFSPESFVIGISYPLTLRCACVCGLVCVQQGKHCNSIMKWGRVRLFENRKAIGSMYNFSFLVISYFVCCAKETYPFHCLVLFGLCETISRFSLVFIIKIDYRSHSILRFPTFVSQFWNV